MHSGSLYKNVPQATPTPVAARPHAKKVVAAPAPPSAYTVEVIRGDKKEETKF